MNTVIMGSIRIEVMGKSAGGHAFPREESEAEQRRPLGEHIPSSVRDGRLKWGRGGLWRRQRNMIEEGGGEFGPWRVMQTKGGSVSKSEGQLYQLQKRGQKEWDWGKKPRISFKRKSLVNLEMLSNTC